ncbi:MAG TPA: SDR family oxidoreductase [Steroidobacteraceae bacterium]|nr:SDR family oxidoreductase [Steroidobacteraceae bacterium]
MTRIEDLSGKAVLITGASSGIGAALARAFAAQGAALALHYNTHEDAARELAAGISATAPAPKLVRGDLSKRGEAKRVVNEAAAALGGLDILINNAGGLGERRPIADVDDALFHARTPQARMDAMRDATALGRVGEAQDCVGAFLFLASNELSGYITGNIVHVNGGMYMP